MQPAAGGPNPSISPTQTAQNAQAKFLEEIASRDKVDNQALTEIFKKNVPNEKSNVRNYTSGLAYKVRDQIYRQNSTAGLELQIKGSLIALKIALNNTSLFQYEEKANIASQIAELETLQKSSPGTILLAKLAKTVDESNKPMLAKLKDPQLAKDFDNIIEIYGSKRTIPSSLVKLLIELRDLNPKDFSDSINSLLAARKKNFESLNKGDFFNKNSVEYKNASTEGAKFIRLLADDHFLTSHSKDQIRELKVFFQSLQMKSVEGNSQWHNNTIVEAIDPDDFHAERTKMQRDEMNSHLDGIIKDREMQLKANPSNAAMLRREIDELKSRKNYFQSPGVSFLIKADWKLDETAAKEGKQVWLRTVGFRTPEGDIKESPVKLDLSKFKDVEQLELFKFLQQADNHHVWIDVYDKTKNLKSLNEVLKALDLTVDEIDVNNLKFKNLPLEVREALLYMKTNDKAEWDASRILPKDALNALNNVKNKDKSDLSDVQKKDLIDTAAKFTREMYVDFYKKLFTLGASPTELGQLSKPPGEVLLQSVAAKFDPSILPLLNDPVLVKDFNNILSIYGTKRAIPPETVALLIQLRQTDPKLFSDSMDLLRADRERNLECIRLNEIPLAVSQTDDLNREARASFSNLVGMLANITDDTTTPAAIKLKEFFRELLAKTQFSNSQLHNETILYAVNPNFSNRIVNHMKKEVENVENQLRSLEKITPTDSRHQQEINRRREYLAGLKGYFSDGFSANLLQKASFDRVPGTSNDWVRTIGFRSTNSTEPYKKEDELQVKLQLSEFADLNQEDLFNFIRIADGNPNWAEKESLRDYLDKADANVGNTQWSDELGLNDFPQLAKAALDKLNLPAERKNRLVAIVTQFTYDINLGQLKKQMALGD